MVGGLDTLRAITDGGRLGAGIPVPRTALECNALWCVVEVIKNAPGGSWRGRTVLSCASSSSSASGSGVGGSASMISRRSRQTA